MDRKRKTKSPCDDCGISTERCFCDQIEVLTLKTKLLLLVHYKELKRTTNSGRLAVKALKNSEMKIRGRDREPLDLTPSLEGEYQSLIFFPSADAVELTPQLVQSFEKPIQLIVPDGNWRQASKVPQRHPELFNVPKVILKIPNTAKDHLRKEHSEFGMSTLEAIARAFGVIEGIGVQDSLLALYKLKLESTLVGRGQVPRL